MLKAEVKRGIKTKGDCKLAVSQTEELLVV
jgi:hypothetical protein